MDKETFDIILNRLNTGDDPWLWIAVWNEIVQPIEAAVINMEHKTSLYIRLGSCSHWHRPHQSRLTVAGGFALPSGYLGGAFSFLGLPEITWQLIFRWDGDNSLWKSVKRFSGKRRLVCRIAVPNRTRRHAQAVVNVRWEPGTIENPKLKATRYYAFRRGRAGWKCKAAGNLMNHGPSKVRKRI